MRPHLHRLTGHLVTLLMLIGLCAVLLAHATARAELPDLPPCEQTVGGPQTPLAIGIVQPWANADVVHYATKLARQNHTITVCSEAWQAVVPGFAPWAKQLERGYGFVVLVLAFLAVVLVLTAITPRQQWRRTTLLGVLSISSATWLLAVLVLLALHAMGVQRLIYGTVISLQTSPNSPPKWHDIAGARELAALLSEQKVLPALASKGQSLPAPAATPPSQIATKAGAKVVLLPELSPELSPELPPKLQAASKPVSNPAPSGSYRTFRRVNLREKPGVESVRILVIAQGQSVQFDGAVSGDWWRIKMADGQVGWVSSIWLRRPEEAVPGGQS